MPSKLVISFMLAPSVTRDTSYWSTTLGWQLPEVPSNSNLLKVFFRKGIALQLNQYTIKNPNTFMLSLAWSTSQKSLWVLISTDNALFPLKVYRAHGLTS